MYATLCCLLHGTHQTRETTFSNELNVGVVPIGVILLGIVPVAKAVQTDRTRADELASSRGFVEVRGQDSGSH